MSLQSIDWDRFSKNWSNRSYCMRIWEAMTASKMQDIEPYWTSIMALRGANRSWIIGSARLCGQLLKLTSAAGWNVEASCKARGAKGRSKEDRPSEWVNPLDSPLENIPKTYKKTIENHHVQWVNPLFLSPFSIAIAAMLVITRGYQWTHKLAERRVQVGPSKLDGGPMTYQAQDHPSSCASQECRAWG